MQSFGSVWVAIEDTPKEAANMRMGSELPMAVEREVRAWGPTRARAAERLGVTRLRPNDLPCGKTAEFSLDAPVVTLSVEGAV